MVVVERCPGGSSYQLTFGNTTKGLVRLGFLLHENRCTYCEAHS